MPRFDTDLARSARVVAVAVAVAGGVLLVLVVSVLLLWQLSDVVLNLFAAVQLLESYLITPLIQQRATALPTATRGSTVPAHRQPISPAPPGSRRPQRTIHRQEGEIPCA